MRNLMFFAAGLMASASPAYACKYMMPATDAEWRANAERRVANARFIIDAVVIRTGGYGQPPALLKARRFLKGKSAVRIFKVQAVTSCDVPFAELGPVGIVALSRGKDGLYSVSMGPPVREAEYQRAIRRAQGKR